MLIHSFFVDKLKVDVYDSRQTMGEAAGKYAVEVIKDLLSKKDEIYIIFAAAPSQNEFLQYVSEAPGIDWGRIHALHMDEYIGNLCRKAGMPYDEWKNNGLEFEKFQAEVFGEESPGGEVRRM